MKKYWQFFFQLQAESTFYCFPKADAFFCRLFCFPFFAKTRSSMVKTLKFTSSTCSQPASVVFLSSSHLTGQAVSSLSKLDRICINVPRPVPLEAHNSEVALLRHPNNTLLELTIRHRKTLTGDRSLKLALVMNSAGPHCPKHIRSSAEKFRAHLPVCSQAGAGSGRATRGRRGARY